MLKLLFLFLLGHQEDITSADSHVTSALASTAEREKYSCWSKMYERDKYARDRVMKSVRLLLPYLKDNDTVLDVGCFTQEAKKYLPPWVTYIGIDEKAYHPKTKVVNLHHGFESIPCQHALCLETLEHLVDPSDTLQSIHQSLSEEGYLIVSLPNESTIFHRIRCLLGIVDYGCFQGEGKHLHLPSLSQSRKFLNNHDWNIQKEEFYISPTACNSGCQWVGKMISLIPERIHYSLAYIAPSLFARGFIFLLKKRQSKEPVSQQ